MVMDCIGDNTDSVVLVSGDSDQEPAIHWITKNCPQKHVTVYIPVSPQEQNKRRVDFYNSIGVLCRPLPLEQFERASTAEWRQSRGWSLRLSA